MSCTCAGISAVSKTSNKEPNPATWGGDACKTQVLKASEPGLACRTPWDETREEKFIDRIHLIWFEHWS